MVLAPEQLPSSPPSSQMRDLVVKEKKNGIDHRWEFPVKFAERAAFAQQHIKLCLLVGTTEVKTSAQ